MGSPGQTVKQNRPQHLQLCSFIQALSGAQDMMGGWGVCPVCGSHQTVTRQTDRQSDSFNFSHTQGQSLQSDTAQKDLSERLRRRSYHLLPSGLSSQASSQNNIYEDIEDSLPSLGSDLYLGISEGRRNHLKSHKFVDWDYEEKTSATNHT